MHAEINFCISCVQVMQIMEKFEKQFEEMDVRAFVSMTNGVLYDSFHLQHYNINCTFINHVCKIVTGYLICRT